MCTKWSNVRLSIEQAKDEGVREGAAVPVPDQGSGRRLRGAVRHAQGDFEWKNANKKSDKYIDFSK